MSFMTRIWLNCIVLLLIIISLWPIDAIWRQRSGSTLARVMACCLTAPSHYLNQCWLIISEVQWHSYWSNFTIDMPQPSITKICMKITCLKFHSNFPGVNELRMVCFHGYRFYPCWRWSPGCQRGARPRKRAQWSCQNIGKLLSPTWDWHIYHC